MSTLSTLAPYLIVVALIIIDVLCADTSNLRDYVRITNNTNPTQLKPENQRNQKFPQQGFSQKSTTTPWPALGQRRRIPQNFQPSNLNNNPTPSWVRSNSVRNRAQANLFTNKAQPNPSMSNKAQLNLPVSNNKAQLNLAASNKAQPNLPASNKAQPKPSMSNKAQLNLPASNKEAQPSLPASNKAQPNLSPVSNKAQPNLPKASVGSQLNTGGNEQASNQKSSSEDSEDNELREFSEILLNKDVNNAAKYVTINYQGKTTSRSEADEAPQPLLSISPDAYKIPSIEKLILLYNNYFLDSSNNEYYTGQEKMEENNLIETITSTPVMQHTRNFLIQKGKLGKDPKEFKSLLREIWFNMYSRGEGRIGSSGFEHVFLAEIKKNQVSGLHNWLYFNDEEMKNEANYLGYMKKIDLGNKGAILKYHFKFHDIDKPVGSMFIGTSPELEIALYSTCFVLRADRICPLKLNGNKFIIRTFTYRYRGKNMIGSAFPEI